MRRIFISSDLSSVGINSWGQLAGAFENLGYRPSTARNYATQHIQDLSRHAHLVTKIVQARRAKAEDAQYLASDEHRKRMWKLKDLGIHDQKTLVSALMAAGYDQDAAEMYKNRFITGNRQRYLFPLIEDAAKKYAIAQKAQTAEASTALTVVSSGSRPASYGRTPALTALEA